MPHKTKLLSKGLQTGVLAALFSSALACPVFAQAGAPPVNQPSFIETHFSVLLPCAVIILLLAGICVVLALRGQSARARLEGDREKSLMLDNLIQNIPGGVGIYKLGVSDEVLYFSDGLATLVGRDKDEFSGWSMSDVLNYTVFDEDIDRIQRIAARAVKVGAPIVASFRMKHKSGRLIWVQLSSVNIRNEKNSRIYYAVFTQMPDESELYQHITDNTITGVYVCDAQTQELIYVNDVLKDTLGRRDYKGKKCYEYINQSSTPCRSCQRALMTEQNYVSREVYLEEQDKYLAFYGHLSESGGKKVIIEYSTDITAIHKQLIAQENRLENALQQAQDADRHSIAFLSQMSHDIRTPMNAIVGLTDLAQSSLGNTIAVNDCLEKIKSSSDFLLSLLNDCMDIENLSQGKIKLHPAPFAYRDFVESITAAVEPMCKEKNITLAIQEKLLANTIVTDRARFEQIFFNLLTNAVKYTPEGGRVELLYQNEVYENDTLTCDYVVSDNGYGMSEEFMARMFRPFELEYNYSTTEHQSTGLGLALVKSIVDLMGGTIKVMSKLGMGTDIIVRLTVPTLPPEVESQEYDRFSEIDKKLAGRHVMLVEDNPVNIIITKRLLEEKHVLVNVAENGRQALNFFEESDVGFFDAILMDIQMPVMDGLEATRLIRGLQRPDAKAVPIIAVTANARREDMEKSLESGISAHLPKPLQPTRMFETLADFISDTDFT